jgi:formate hydrogenlyase transcriptional activator
MNCAPRRLDDHRNPDTIDSGTAFDWAIIPFTPSEDDDVNRPHRNGRAADAHGDLCREITGVQRDGAIVYTSEAIRSVLSHVHHVAPTNATVLLLGETGVGKELFARAIHKASPRRHLPMISVNCAAIPTTLIESELFGHERGAFTDAVARQIGRFEAANGSTIFLDEIGDMPLEVQVKLLRVLEERIIERLGSHASTKVDVRIVAATHRDLQEAVKNNRFREDLYYRLNVFPIRIPPLRERVDDVPCLAWTFAQDMSRAFRKSITGISRRSLIELQQYLWPGNVRELRNVIEREMIRAVSPILKPAVPLAGLSRTATRSERLLDVQAEHIRSVLESCGWRIRGAGGAAQLLGLKPTTLETRMARLGIFRRRQVS